MGTDRRDFDTCDSRDGWNCATTAAISGGIGNRNVPRGRWCLATDAIAECLGRRPAIRHHDTLGDGTCITIPFTAAASAHQPGRP